MERPELSSSQVKSTPISNSFESVIRNGSCSEFLLFLNQNIIQSNSIHFDSIPAHFRAIHLLIVQSRRCNAHASVNGNSDSFSQPFGKGQPKNVEMSVVELVGCLFIRIGELFEFIAAAWVGMHDMHSLQRS